MRYEAYKKLAAPAVELCDGETKALECDWHPNTLTILPFEDVWQAKTSLHSDEYSPAKSIRHQVAISKMIAIDGV